MMIYIAHFFAGFFLVNTVPHFVQGVSGNPFQSPFASPPGVGESSAVINVLWGFANAVIGYYLLFEIGDFNIGLNADTFAAGSGALVTGVGLAWHFERVRNNTA
jgi:hypothetical protein